MKQMPEEGKRFKIVDSTWRGMMQGAQKDLRALQAMR